ncbi:NlpC/P60 family protein [Aneurinibacillus thermoaerophilus]|uniref:NlpC/P60 family protein n=1 Tax=Aneurinibacillus thermoaerophilus TaxID=143495 RepID=A0A1G7X7Z9_ANETH|nr:C40 family peptidase [Aneurinibacillus thermoaerophilus]SDG80301.1 NlpC/P60 family protein [Aneurinibacillus thermoaerophilus]
MKPLSLMFLAVLLALLGNGFPVGAESAASKKSAYVDVAVATLWIKPDIVRPVDAPSLTHPVDMWKWTRSMTLEEKLGLVPKLETQALYGNKVTILERKGKWVKVAVHGQPTPRNAQGYPGWMLATQLTYNERFAAKDGQPFVLITSPTAKLYNSATLKHEEMEISYNTRLPYEHETKDAYQVLKPDGKHAWVKKQDAKVYASMKAIPKPTGEQFVKTGKKFLGLPYLWAGMSGFGFDCSGFTFTVYQSHGITIPRDSSVQAKYGTPVAKEKLKPGDLLFFAYNQGKGKVHHVAMYAGDGMMIHSPNSARTVEIIPVDTPEYAKEFAGARRYLK